MKTELQLAFELVISQLVNHPQNLNIAWIEGDTTTLIEISPHAHDVKHLIGRQGNTISSIRSLFNIIAHKHGRKISIEVNEPKESK